MTHMSESVGVRELRQNLSKYLDRVKTGESLVVTEHGREVARLVDGTQPAGFYDVTLPAGRLSSGVYLYKVQAGEAVAVRKMMLMR